MYVWPLSVDFKILKFVGRKDSKSMSMTSIATDIPKEKSMLTIF